VRKGSEEATEESLDGLYDEMHVTLQFEAVVE
jgi:hypothetical protein